jgi:HlyD family secretion protein
MKFEGTVSEVRLQPVTTNNVVTYVVILSAPNPDKKLMPGMTASATIYVEEKTNTLVISGKAVRFTPDKEYMAKMFAKMQATGVMPKIPAGAPSGAGSMPQGASGTITGNQAGPTQGMPSPGMAFGPPNNDPKTKTVWVKDDRMGIRPSIIKIGIDNGTSVEVISGLNEGDEVVISAGDNATGAAKKTNNGPPGFPF